MNSLIEGKKIAIVYDWLTGISGTDRVLKAIHEIYPHAPIYLLFGKKQYIDEYFLDSKFIFSSIQSLFLRFNKTRILTLLIPTVIENFDLSDYDIVISVGASYSKGVITSPKTLHISYCHSPTRQIWDWAHEYKREQKKLRKPLTLIAQHLSRFWDRHASTRVSYYIANSKCIQQRIKKYYNRESHVIYPPVDNLEHKFNKDQTIAKNDPYYLIVSRLHKHKNIDIAIKAFNKLEKKLVVIGEGPESNFLKSIARNNVSIIGYQSEDSIYQYYKNCEAFIMPQEEDFGITGIEALNFGKPVIALKKGGALEYIQEGINGVFFDDPFEGSLANAVRSYNDHESSFDSNKIKEAAILFSKQRFKKEFSEFVLEKMYEYENHYYS